MLATPGEEEERAAVEKVSGHGQSEDQQEEVASGERGGIPTMTKRILAVA